MGSSEIKKDLQDFQTAVKKLSDGIGRAGSLWSDAKFSELSSSVGMVATQSKDLMVSGDKCCSSIDRFDMIAAEKY
ncbi:MAG: hypothetical protein NC489_24700 [Ruminococcus flavefaciens]|nr:hypothetical protein [Ruminococcus flavefaciens]